MEKSADAFRTISEVAADLALPQHVLRFWETRFPQIRPLKRAGGRRYYRPADVGLLRSIRRLLYDEGYTIKGVQRLLKEQGARGLTETDVGSPRDRGDDGRPHGPAPHDAPFDAAVPVDEGDDSVPPVGPSAELDVADRDRIREALDCIEDCERILGAVLPRG